VARWEDAESARAAYRRAVDSGDAGGAAEALDRLGRVLCEQGDPDGARAAFPQAIDSGDPSQRTSALMDLGHMLGELGDVAGARAAFQQAADSGDPSLAWLAVHYLQNWPWDRGTDS
jgi:Tfp pilus assembly protein PilF